MGLKANFEHQFKRSAANINQTSDDSIPMQGDLPWEHGGINNVNSTAWQFSTPMKTYPMVYPIFK